MFSSNFFCSKEFYTNEGHIAKINTKMKMQELSVQFMQIFYGHFIRLFLVLRKTY